MSRFSFRRTAVALVLGSILVSSWVSASEVRGHAGHPTATREMPGLFGQILGMFAGFLTKAGCSADPFGHCAGQPTADNGCSLDPNGRCKGSMVTADAGCSADPNGHCVSGH